MNQVKSCRKCGRQPKLAFRDPFAEGEGEAGWTAWCLCGGNFPSCEGKDILTAITEWNDRNTSCTSLSTRKKMEIHQYEPVPQCLTCGNEDISSCVEVLDYLMCSTCRSRAQDRDQTNEEYMKGWMDCMNTPNVDPLWDEIFDGKWSN
jgi:hypothetical protein